MVNTCDNISFGILTVSDRCFNKVTVDTAGPKVRENILLNHPAAEIRFQIVVPDEIEVIKSNLLKWTNKCDIIITVGGTGFGSRDVTPEATKAVIQKEAPGLAYAMIAGSLKITPMAMLSRLVCGIRENTLIINLPGSEKGAVENFEFIVKQLRHAVNHLRENVDIVRKEHGEKVSIHKKGLNESHEEPSKVKCLPSALRNRSSIYPMIEVDETHNIIRAEVGRSTKLETIPIQKSLNRILADDIFAKQHVPAVPTSKMDGYAVVASDLQTRKVVDFVAAAGDKPVSFRLKENEAVRISTGAAIPNGANAVVKIEDTEAASVTADNEENEIFLKVIPGLNEHIREIGCDIARESKVLNKFDVISSEHIGLLATIGQTHVRVIGRPSIGILSTGNELQPLTNKLEPGQIYDSNKITLQNLLQEFSYESDDCGVAKDNANSLKSAFSKAFDKHDFVISTGGVSMGEFDLVKEVLIEDFGALIHFGRVNMKPGKPTTFATVEYKGRKKTIFALPGNPLSASVTLILFVIPTLRFIERHPNPHFPRVNAYYEGDLLNNNDIRPAYVGMKASYSPSSKRLFINKEKEQNMNSSRLKNLINCNALVILSPKKEIKSSWESIILFKKL